jgi:hypothetical protein
VVSVVNPSAAPASSPSAAPMPTPTNFSLPISGGLFVITNVNLQGVSYNSATGALTISSGTVTGTLGGIPFITNINNFLVQSQSDGPGQTCAILNLEIAPISLNLLGLLVDTSSICLVITATQGGLLGDLLCGLANGDLSILPILQELLRDLITIATANPSPLASPPTTSVCSGRCIVLSLVLGPVELNLLGLNVVLDNCDNGPVQVCLSANPNQGLLGNLLCGLAGQ